MSESMAEVVAEIDRLKAENRALRSVLLADVRTLTDDMIAIIDPGES